MLGSLLAALGCGVEPSPEEQVRRAIDDAAEAAAARDIGALREWIAESYRDDRGRGKREIEDFLRAWLFRSQKLYVLTLVRELSVESEQGRASAGLYAALASQPIDSARDLRNIRADLYWLELDLEQQGDDWRVVAASWRLASPSDLSRELL